MNLSDNMKMLRYFIDGFYFGFRLPEHPDLSVPENALKELKDFVNSRFFLDEFNKLANRLEREIQAEKLQRKGL